MITFDELKVETSVRSARLVVCVPEGLEDFAEFARQVYWLAAAQQRAVLYLSKTAPDGDTLAASRLLTSITALTQDQAVRAAGRQVQAASWADVLRQAAHPGDIVLWPEAQPPAGLDRELGVTLQVITGLYASSETSAPRWVHGLVYWLSGLAILVVFTLMEYSLTGAVHGTLLKLLLGALVAIEFGLLYQWDRILH